MRERLKTLNYVAKKIISRDTFKKIKKIKDRYEKINVLKNSISSSLDLKLYRIEMELNDLHKKEIDIFVIFSKFNLLKTKIKYFNATFHKKDFEVLWKLFKDIEKELNNL